MLDISKSDQAIKAVSAVRKILVTTGVYFVDIPEIGLHILCGCPADTVKHLMKRGLIQTVETQGVLHENGPNAILLSDLGVQGGGFCNMAEFLYSKCSTGRGSSFPIIPKMMVQSLC